MRHGPSAGKPQSGLLATGERLRCFSTCALLFCLGLILLSPQVSPRCPNGTSMSLGLAIHRVVTRTTHPLDPWRSLGRDGGVVSILTLRYVSKDATCDLSWESPWRDIMPGPPFPPHRGLVPVVSLLLSNFCCLFVWLQFPDSRSVPITKSFTHTIQLSLPSPIGLSRTPRTRQLRSGAVLHNTHPLPTLPSHVTGRQERRSRGALTKNIPLSRLRPLPS